MSIAYLISAYRQPALLRRLVERLSGDGVSFLIHLDAKVDGDRYFSGMREVLARPEVHLVPSTRCDWGRFGHVQASLNGIRLALERRVPFEHLALLTGQDYPIKPVSALREHLAGHPRNCFLEYHRLPRPGWPQDGGLERMQHRSIGFLGRRWRFPNRVIPLPPKRRIPLGLIPYQGSSYWWLSRACVEHVSDFVADHPEYVRFFRSAFAPDESFFHMIVLNSRFAAHVVDDDLRFSEWGSHAPRPATLTEGHFEALRDSAALVARKFDLEVAPRLLDRVDRELLREARFDSGSGGPLSVKQERP
jgi:hypothetical protein